MYLAFAYIYSFYIMLAGAYRDRFTDVSKDWLRRHIASWMCRDWPIVAFHTALVPFLWESIGWFAILLYAASAALHYWFFVVGYGGRDAVLIERRTYYSGKPAWYIWRAWQLLPGVPVGLIFWVI